VNSAEEIRNVLEAFDLTGPLRDAGELPESRITPSATTLLPATRVPSQLGRLSARS
jgi:hypothetical protein